MLKYAAFDIPYLENKIRKLTSDFIDLEFRKKDLNNTIILQRAHLSDLGQAIIRYQNAIDNKKRGTDEMSWPEKDLKKNNKK